MKVAIPTSDGYRISSNAKRIRGFVVYEIIDSKIVKEKYILKNHVNGDNGNNGTNEEVVDELRLIAGINDCQIVISNGLGKVMFEELLKAQKEVYITEANDSRIAIKHFIRQTLRNHPEMAEG